MGKELEGETQFHNCDGIENEKKRLLDIGYFPIVEVKKIISVDDTFTAMVHLFADNAKNQLINLSVIDVHYCPYCGSKLEE